MPKEWKEEGFSEEQSLRCREYGGREFETMEKKELNGIEENLIWIRLNSQIAWYVDKSRYNKKWYKGLKFLQIVMAISIPVISHIDASSSRWGISIMGALIAIFESMQYMNQYETLWVSHRSTAEKLKREKFLFLGMAGPYRSLKGEDGVAYLAEQIEEHVHFEQSNWVNQRKNA